MTDTSTHDTSSMRLKVDLPDHAADAADELSREIGALEAVESASAAATRFGLGGIVMLVQLAGGALANAGTIASVVERLVATIRGQGVTGAKITLPGGGTIEVDHASVEDIERLVGAVGAGSRPDTAGG